MAQYSVAVRNAKLDAIESTIGAAPILRIRTGAAPANCAAADSGTVLVEMTLPADWMAAAAAGVKAKAGVWSGVGAADGVAAHYRIYDPTDTDCHEQGTVGATGSGEDIELDNTNIATGQTVTISTFSKTEGNA